MWNFLTLLEAKRSVESDLTALKENSTRDKRRREDDLSTLTEENEHLSVELDWGWQSLMWNFIYTDFINNENYPTQRKYFANRKIDTALRENQKAKDTIDQLNENILVLQNQVGMLQNELVDGRNNFKNLAEKFDTLELESNAVRMESNQNENEKNQIDNERSAYAQRTIQLETEIAQHIHGIFNYCFIIYSIIANI